MNEPSFPQTCSVFRAVLHANADEGPLPRASVEDQDDESNVETAELQQKLDRCEQGKAVELSLGTDPRRNAFLISPINVPVGVSLILDGGVTLYASRDPALYQQQTPGVTCGDLGPKDIYKVGVGCNSLITLTANSGIYGYGVIDGQGGKLLLSGPYAHDCTWWDLTNFKNRPSQPGASCVIPYNGMVNGQASPILISAGNAETPVDQPADCDKGRNSLNCDLTLYKVTVRNPPYHSMRFGGQNVTIWGIRVQSPWNIPNTDGMDIHASNVTVYDATVANGDQEVTLVSNEYPSTNITIDHFHGYGKAGITTLGAGVATSNILVTNAYITGDLPSVNLAEQTVNGQTFAWMQKKFQITGLGQALMNAVDVDALAINNTTQSRGIGSKISNVAFQSICVADVRSPINLELDATDSPLPSAKGITFRDVHVLAPSDQKQTVRHPDGSLSGIGTYDLEFIAPGTVSGGETSTNEFTLDNVVLDNFADGTTSLGLVTASNNLITTTTNIYPAVLNGLHADSKGVSKKVDGTKLMLTSNDYQSTTEVNDPTLAYQCPAPPSFLTGDLFVSLGEGPAYGQSTNLQQAYINSGDSITLSAVVQPAMSQTTLFTYMGYAYNPGLLSIGSPALTNQVRFYEEDRYLGSASLRANGTLASLVLEHVSPGHHKYRAEYPADKFYKTFSFGQVTVAAAAKGW
ncbi:glycosyl hydrolase family 28 protein [Acidisarcina polymorpha]|uniref:glycosyl hydrolase family 28 protein n=1 Tax=Acidisarcina polymorpha TaxID=2211140 RepID=UPI0013751832|nr:glycosyl hydrolase family 28 protein [Acidisarcina polymorpha]